MGGKARVGIARGLTRALGELAPVLERYSGHSLLIGGIAVIAHGVPRVTRDIDIAFAGAEVALSSLAAELALAGFVFRIEGGLAFAAESQVLLLRHTQTGVEVDVSLAWLPFEMEAMAAASSMKVSGVVLPVAQPEDLVIYKAIAWRPQDQQDVERLLFLHGSRMNFVRIRRHVRELGEAMEQDRLQGLDALIRRVVG